jgi:hypothetical protein
MKKTHHTTSLNPLETEIAVTALQASGNFKILRKLDLQHDARFSKRPITKPCIGLCLDTETTGLTTSRTRS